MKCPKNYGDALLNRLLVKVVVAVLSANLTEPTKITISDLK